LNGKVIVAGVSKVLQYFGLLKTLGESFVNNDFTDFITEVATQYGKNSIDEEALNKYKSKDYTLGWAFELFSLSNSFEELQNAFADKPSIYRDVFNHCAYDTKYGVFVRFKNGEKYNISDISEIM
jgi:hypothetical protein